MEHHRLTLTNELARRQSRNPSYSLRAFASSLSVSPAALSQVLNGHRHFCMDAASRVAEKLGLNPIDRMNFINSATGAKSKQRKSKRSAQKWQKAAEIQLDFFELLSEWHYLAILNLARLRPALDFDAAIIADRLGIQAALAQESLERLQRMKLISNRHGKLARTAKDMRLAGGTPSAAVRKFHRQNLERAINALDAIPTAERDFSSITFAMSSDQIDAVRKLIASFRDQVSRLSDLSEPNQVYTLALQLFPQSSGKKL